MPLDSRPAVVAKMSTSATTPGAGVAPPYPATPTTPAEATDRRGNTPGEQAILDLLASCRDGFTPVELAARCDTTPNSAKVLIHRLRAKGYPIASPRHASRAGPRKGIRQAYRLADDA